jgi:hypothetical protein
VVIDEVALVRDEDAFVSDSGCVDLANDIGGLPGQGIRMMSTGLSSSQSGERITCPMPGT